MQQSPLDQFITAVDGALRAVTGSVGSGSRPSPATAPENPSPDPHQRQLAASLMRVNHCGEVCAQALYQGQALTAKTPRVAQVLRHAAAEETDHLAWCEHRLRELDSHVSYLNPFWYAASFAMGAATGLLGDKINLGFVAAVEEEVSLHLERHLTQLPDSDQRTRQILAQMQTDERKHAADALELGGTHFPAPVKAMMRRVSRLMTRSAYWV
jgi:3-demethoxyubiquinol 3-hydroxylase